MASPILVWGISNAPAYGVTPEHVRLALGRPRTSL